MACGWIETVPQRGKPTATVKVKRTLPSFHPKPFPGNQMQNLFPLSPRCHPLSRGACVGRIGFEGRQGPTRSPTDAAFPSSLAKANVMFSVSETRTRRRRRRRKANGDAKKRRLSDEQVRFLEMSFRDERKLASGRKAHLAKELGLDGNQVAVWFQNRRARHKNKQLEETYLKLKLEHEAVLRLKEKLLEAEEEIRKLSWSVNGGNLGSSFSAVSLQPTLGEFGMEEEAELAYMDEYDFYNYTMEWTNPYGI
ncbi:hypothetical protein B296_00005971 [Ensete ventricosum]|uniref:Homeobox-leucine zipper protein n=1 Tax=Ensete ventricosum TaxID=4639 RepID=A0A426ZD73_ENSVE|nr:hypothetical protein B296_00005971 [Ensete ventricosum]